MNDQGQPTTQDQAGAAAWSRVQQYLNKLSDALADLDEVGGIAGVARSQGWKPGKFDKAKTGFKAIRDQLDAGLARLKSEHH